MKVLFLDIDGVVNRATTTQVHRGFLGIDPLLAGFVRRIKEDTGCELVLSSTWRQVVDGRAEVDRKVAKTYDETPSLESGIRGDEIQAWLDAHPEVTRYAIVDDIDSWFHEGQPVFKTETMTGLTPQTVREITAYLNGADEAGGAC